MRAVMWVIVLVVILGAAVAMRSARRAVRAKTKTGTHVVLIGASIGRDWRLAEWPARLQAPELSAESIAVWQFDKSEAVDEVLLRPRRKFRPTRSYLKSWFETPPRKADIVILKECSSYFPGEPRAYRESVQRWARRLQAHGIRVILATVAPVTRERARHDSGKQEALLEYNRWLREYARTQRLPVLDLESALAVGEHDAYLRDEFTSGDGSHLNARAYAVLDHTLRAVLCGAALDREWAATARQ